MTIARNFGPRDARLLISAIKRHSPSTEIIDFWERGLEEDVLRIARKLLNPEVPEREVIRRIIRERRPKSLLDCGCGPAGELSGYKSHGINVGYFGIDRSSRMISLAREDHREAKFIQGNVESLPFGNRTFDVALLKHVLEHLPSYQVALREATRVAKDFVIVDFFRAPTPLPFDLRLKNKRGYWENHYSGRRINSFLNSLNLRGYETRATRGEQGQTAVIYILNL